MSPLVRFELKRSGGMREVEAKPGESVMVVATRNLVPGIIGECGGELSCATCHVYCEDQSAFAPMSDDENELLELADQRTDASRLGCQLKIGEHTPDTAVTVTVPNA